MSNIPYTKCQTLPTDKGKNHWYKGGDVGDVIQLMPTVTLPVREGANSRLAPSRPKN